MLKIARVLHAGYLFQTEQASILFDPIFESPFSRNCYSFPAVEFDVEVISNLKIDAIFISHHHDDHFSLDSLKHLNKNTPVYFYSHVLESFEWIQVLGFKNVHSLKLNKTIEIGDIAITPLRALDKFVDCLFKIQYRNIKVLNVVDSWIDWEMLAELASEAPWDVVLWPFQSMRELEVISPSRFPVSNQRIPEEHIKQLEALNPKTVVPSSCQFIHESWSWYRKAYFPISYSSFAEQVNSFLPTTQIQRIDPSEIYILDKEMLSIAGNLLFVKQLDSKEIDYEYDPKLIPPPTREIAQNLENISEEQTQKVLQFLALELLERYKKLDFEVAPYFMQTRMWELRVFTQKGQAITYHYKIEREYIEILLDPSNRLSDWVTEIPLSRVWGALYLGESLTSLYIRVNDERLSDSAERDIANTDIAEDPLIRVLYSGEDCSYQRAQLLRIGN